MTKFQVLLFVASFLMTGYVRATSLQPCRCDKYITLQEHFVDGAKLGAVAGDTICIKAGHRRSLKLFNFNGSAQAPIVLINQGGLVEIGDPTWHFGLVIDKSQHFVLTGTGDEAHLYGIKIAQTKKGATGLALGASDFDVNHIEVAHTGFAGIMAKIDPHCDPDSWQENFVMKNIRLHHNYIHHTGGEGIYVGYTKPERTLTCDGQPLTVKPHNLEHVCIFDNKIDHTGWDGIQVSRAVSHCEIYRNQVFNYGEKNENWQKAGIVVGGETTGRLYGNLIHTGTGGGIHVLGSGENLIYNNIIIDAGEDGIFCKSVQEKENNRFGYAILNNTIIDPQGYGLKMHSMPRAVNYFHNNWIAQSKQMFMTNSPAFLLKTSHNYFTKTRPEFQKAFLPVPSGNCRTALADRGMDISGYTILTDYTGAPRITGTACDIGALEY